MYEAWAYRTVCEVQSKGRRHPCLNMSIKTYVCIRWYYNITSHFRHFFFNSKTYYLWECENRCMQYFFKVHISVVVIYLLVVFVCCCCCLICYYYIFTTFYSVCYLSRKNSIKSTFLKSNLASEHNYEFYFYNTYPLCTIGSMSSQMVSRKRSCLASFSHNISLVARSSAWRTCMYKKVQNKSI